MKQIDVADLDCVYLSYDEPEKEEFWVQIKNMVPWATRSRWHQRIRRGTQGRSRGQHY
jgi:hypothetical protein